MTARRVDLNADVGEGFGLYAFGNDAELLPLVSSASVACGWHAGDPSTMRATVALAVEHRVAIGAHVSYPDLLGFGRRRMQASPDEIHDWVLYQAGALAAFVEAAGGRLQHVKPHGGLYYACCEEGEVAEAVARATCALGEHLHFVGMGRVADAAAKRADVRFAAEGFVDLEYAGPERLAPGCFSADDPDTVASRAVSIVVDGRATTRDGAGFSLAAATLCVHGHLPGAVANARRVRSALEAAGATISPLDEAASNEVAER